MTKPVVIVGAGPSGLACAQTLSAAGVAVVVIDDNARPGGQYFRQLPLPFTSGRDSRLLRDAARGRALIEVLSRPQVRYLPETTAWMAPSSHTIAYAGPKGSGRVEASHVVLATGAHDRPQPFPGWTLPGVVSAGGALNLAKGQGQRLDGRVVVVGNGPLLLVVAATLVTAGSRVTHVIESAESRQVWPALPGMVHAPGLLWKGLDYRRRLLMAGTRVLNGWTLAEARGSSHVTGARLVPMAADGSLRHDAGLDVEADWIVSGFGLQPSAEFARHLGCQLQHDPARGGWIPTRSAELETSLAGVFAVGDGAGIGGVEVALAEGTLAAHAVLARLGLAAPDASKARRALAGLERFRTGLGRLYQAPVPDLARDDTIVCRCEDVTAGELRGAIDAGADDLVRLKGALRVGMGRCQGRNCYASAAQQIGRQRGCSPGVIALPRSRGPLRPVRIAQLLDESLPPAREPDSITLFEAKREAP